jgi:hypothetical protein
MSAHTKMSFKLLGLLKAKTTYTTNRQINISTCPHRVVILNIAPKVFRTAKPSESNASVDEVFSVNTTCFVKTMVNACIVVTPLFQMTFQFPKPFFGGLFVGADAFDSEKDILV